MPTAPDGPLWDFAKHVYALPGVSDACLALQDDYHVDVNVLLFGAWVGLDKGVELSAGELEQALDEVRAWADAVVRPLRAVRRTMKSGPPPAPSPLTEATRTRLKAVELEAERIELWVLQEAATRIRTGDDDGNAAMRANMIGIVSRYAGSAADARAIGLVATVAEAADQIARRNVSRNVSSSG